MTLIRLSDAERDCQVLVNLDQIVQVSATQGPRGRAERAFTLAIRLADGSQLSCFPLDEYGGFDATTNDESEVIRNFQRAAQRIRSTPDVEQGRVL